MTFRTGDIMVSTVDETVARTAVPDYSIKNIYGIDFLLMQSEVNFVLKSCKDLTLAKANVYYKDAPKHPVTNVPDKFLVHTTTKTAQYYHGMAGILSELWEVDEAVMTGTKHEVAVEIGDCVWFLCEMARANGLTLTECIAAMEAKLKARFPEKFENSLALERNLLAEQMAYENAVDMAKETVVKTDK